MKIIKLLLLMCVLSSTTAFSQPEEVHSFADTSAGYFETIQMEIKVSDGLIIAGIHKVNNVPQPIIAKINVAGEIVWSATTPSPMYTGQFGPSMAIKLFEDGFVYGSSFKYQQLQLLWKVNAQTGEIAWIIPFASAYEMVSAITELDSSRFTATFSNSPNDTQLAIFNKTSGTVTQQSQINTSGSTYYNTALDRYGNLYLSFKDQVRKYNGTDLNQVLWQRTYLDGTVANHLDEIHKMYLDPSGDIFLFGRNGNTYGHGDGMIVRINPFTGDQVWKIIATYEDVKAADFVDRNGCLYVTYQHTVVGGGTFNWRTAKVAKSTGQVLWSNILFVTPQAGASTDITLEQAALSLDVDCNGDVYQTGYYGAANYGPGNWGIMKLDGATGAKLYDLTVSEDSTAADTQSTGNVAAVFGNTLLVLGQLEIGTSNESKAHFVAVNTTDGTILVRHTILAGYSQHAYVADIVSDGSGSFVLKQVGTALKVKHYLNGNPSWEAPITGNDIIFGKKLAVSTNSVYVFGRKVLSSATPPFYQQATNQLVLYWINRSTGTLQNTQFIPSLMGDSHPLQLAADDTKSYLFYSKSDSIYYRSWDGFTLSPEFVLDSLSPNLSSTESVSIIHNEATHIIVATLSGIYRINKSTLAKTLFLAYPQPMEITSVSGKDSTLYIAGRSGSEALAASVDLNAASFNWFATYPTAMNFNQISTDGYFLYVSAKDDSTTASVRQLALIDGTENWSQTITGAGNTIVTQTITPSNNHDYVVVGGKITEPTGGSNAFITMVSYNGTLLENYVLDDELGTESFISNSAVFNDSTTWLGGAHNTASQPKYGRVFSMAYTAPPIILSSSDTACASYSWSVSGLTYTTSGVYSDTIANPIVDTIHMLYLTILEPTTSDSIVTVCETYTWNGTNYTTSGTYTWSGTNAAGCDSVATLYLTILLPSTGSLTIESAGPYTWPVNGQTYSTSGTYVDTIPNAEGCDSINTLFLTIYPSSGINVYSMPSDPTECTGAVAFTLTGVPDFTIDIGNGNPITTGGYTYFDSLCAGMYSAFITDGNGDTLSTTFVIPSDSTYIFNNPFVDSLALDSLGTVIDDCDIYYNSIDSAYIANIFANADTVTVTWEIVDSSGVTSIVTTYILGNGSGVYNLQLSIFCPQKSTEKYFTVTQAIYYDGSEAHLVGINDLESLNIGLYPNPTTDFVTMVFTQPSLELKLCDSSGKIISLHTLNSGQQISLAQMPSGVYFFDIRTPEGDHVVKRVVKQ